MSNPNFLTANTQGIELMPGVNDNAIGYDVNRIIQALNGTNLVPITTGNLTVSGNETISGTLSVTGAVTFSNLVGPLTINPGALVVQNPSAANDADFLSTDLQSGSDGTLQALHLELVNHPSATAGSRFSAIRSADFLNWRTLKLNDVGGAVVIGPAGLTITGGGAAITGNSTITGTLAVSGVLTAQTAANGIVMGTGVNALTLNDQQTTAQTLSFPNIREAETVAVRPQLFTNNNLASGGLAVTTTTAPGQHLGLGSSVTLTPQVTGRVRVSFTYDISNGTSGDSTFTNVRFGTGTAPVLGAAATGSQPDGSPSHKLVGFTSGTFTYDGTQDYVITGLTLGTTYWFDLITYNNGGTNTISRCSAIVQEF